MLFLKKVTLSGVPQNRLKWTHQPPRAGTSANKNQTSSYLCSKRCGAKTEHCVPLGQKNLQLLQRKAFRAVSHSEFHLIMAISIETTPAGQGDQLWKKGICSSHPWPLLVKVKTAGQGCDFHESCAEIPGTPICVFVMRTIFLTKGPLQAHSAGMSKQGPVI